jgi:hypothetical protein
MKIYKINVLKQKIEELDAPTKESDGGIDIQFIADEIGCDFFDVVRINDGDCIYVDDIGLCRDGMQGAFNLDGYEQPLVGNGLVIGSNWEGESTEPVISKKDLTALIKFGYVVLGGEPAQKNNN